jgi:hypothetical protein
MKKEISSKRECIKKIKYYSKKNGNKKEKIIHKNELKINNSYYKYKSKNYKIKN